MKTLENSRGLITSGYYFIQVFTDFVNSFSQYANCFAARTDVNWNRLENVVELIAFRVQHDEGLRKEK